MVFENPTIREILDRYKQIWALRHASALMDWDVQTYMPPQGIEHRSIAIAQLSLLSQKFITDPSFIALVEKAEGAS
jgi:Zn-dependent carboxypeptidase